MSIPASFIRDGFQPPQTARVRRFLPGLKRPGIMIGTEGETNTGKTEFIMSCPGPGIVLAVDRMFDAVLDNPEPPPTRQADYVFQELNLGVNGMAENFVDHWNMFRNTLYRAIANPDARTVGIDGDSDTWELQRLAEFGKLEQIPSIMYTKVNAARRAMIARCYDSGKIIVATNKIKDEYVPARDAQGNVKLDKSGKEIREKSGNQVRQGFDDQNYLWHIQLKHLYQPPKINAVTKKMMPGKFGIVILKCKSKPDLAGTTLWGDECNFATLVQLAYPQVDLKEWGL